MRVSLFHDSTKRYDARRAITCSLLVGLIGLFSAATLAQQAKLAESRRIDKYCKTLDAMIKKRRGPEMVFADVSDYEKNNKARWRKFASEKALEKYREKSEAYTIAYVWRKQGKVVVTNFTLFSPSGDWAQYVYSHFRPDGKLARVESELRTFQGDYIVIKRLYFNPAGKVIRRTSRYLDLQSRKPKRPSKEFASENSSWNNEDYFKSVSKLPFARLLRK